MSGALVKVESLSEGLREMRKISNFVRSRSHDSDVFSTEEKSLFGGGVFSPLSNISMQNNVLLKKSLSPLVLERKIPFNFLQQDLRPIKQRRNAKDRNGIRLASLWGGEH